MRPKFRVARCPLTGDAGRATRLPRRVCTVKGLQISTSPGEHAFRDFQTEPATLQLAEYTSRDQCRFTIAQVSVSGSNVRCAHWLAKEVQLGGCFD